MKNGVLRLYGGLILSAIILFLGVIAYLTNIQEAYISQEQFISELALGAQGYLLRYSFLALAFAVFCMFFCFTGLVRYLFVVSAFGFVAAGYFTLGAYDALHIAMVLVAFVALATAMFVVARQNPVKQLRVFSAVILAITLLGVVLTGLDSVPVGLAQRISAIGVVGWLLGISLHLLWVKQLRL